MSPVGNHRYRGFATFEILASLSRDLQALQTLNRCLDRVFRDVSALGFQSLVYDYAPVPLSIEGALITPTVFMQRNAPGDMQHVWCAHGYYQHDPVQQRATRRTTPFVWSYHTDGNCAGVEYVGGQHWQVTRYLCDSGMGTGATVPAASARWRIRHLQRRDRHRGCRSAAFGRSAAIAFLAAGTRLPGACAGIAGPAGTSLPSHRADPSRARVSAVFGQRPDLQKILPRPSTVQPPR